MQETLRTKRVAELIRQEVSNVIRDSVHDPKVKDVVITAVKVSVDLDLAKIYWTTYNNDAVKGIQAGLERSAGFIRKEILKSVRLKKVPKLEFVIDDSRQEADKIDNLLSLIEKDNH
ncbi:MAG: 30S ribosome-binding factor RbfA [Mucispirillum sp.]|nr:30S ribosome-binding factor RbfA [Mucispirillum sp.]